MVMAVGPGKWTLTPEIRSQASMQLLCFHHSGAGAYSFRTWPKALPASVEVVAVQLPGRENRFSEPPLRNAGDVLDELIPNLLELIDRPYAIFGHSLGAALAYMFALRVQRTAALPPPVHLFVSSARPPGSAKDAAVSPMSNDALMETLRRLGGTPAQILENDASILPFLPALRADFEILHSVVAGKPHELGIPITAMCGSDDRAVTSADMARWSSLSSEPTRTHTLRGGHFYFLQSSAKAFTLIAQTLQAEPIGGKDSLAWSRP